MVNVTHPIFGVIETGANAYAEIIASPRGAGDYENKEYTNMIVWCSTKNAIISLDGGVTNNILVEAGKAPMRLDGLKITQAIKAKNAVTDQNFIDLTVIVW